MNNRIQLTEEYAREILDECACTETCDFKLDETISVMKQKGYIIKSELQQKVEEAEKYYAEWRNYRIGEKITYGGEAELVNFYYDTIQLLKQSHPEFKK